MDRERLKPYFDVLELDPTAPVSEVRTAYMMLKELYSDPESIVTGPLAGEMGEESRRDILERIEEAYRVLLAAFEQDREEPRRRIEEVTADIETFDGPSLRKVRERLGVDLNDMALATRIQAQHLTNIENENFAALPVKVYTRGFVANYARHLHLDEKRVVADYMARFEAERGDD